jgi:hypothetical protein
MNFISERKRRNVIRMAGLFSSAYLRAPLGELVDLSPKMGLDS